MAKQQYKPCNQILSNGSVCASPALQSNHLCYYHNRAQQRHGVFKQARQLKLSKDFADYPAKQEQLNPEILEALELPAFDDPAAIAIALYNVTKAIISGHIDSKRGGLVLYALQIASMNVERLSLKLKLYGTDRIVLNDPAPIEPLYPEDCAYFPVPNHADGERAPQRTAGSTLGNLPRNDFPSMNVKPDATDPKVIAANLARVSREMANPDKATPENANRENANPANSRAANSAATNEKKSNGKARDYFPYAKEASANPADH